MDSIKSFDALPDNLKECFLDMSSFGKDQKIIASTVIDVWYGLYGTENIICMNYLQDLASHNLLKILPLVNPHNSQYVIILTHSQKIKVHDQLVSTLSQYKSFNCFNIRKKEYEDGFFNEFLVKQDNMFREFAIQQCQQESFSIIQRKRLNLDIHENKLPNWCLNLEQPVTLNASLLSICTDDSFTSSWVEMDCPNVEVLVLNLFSSNYALPNFIATMKKLKVVLIINHGLELTKLTNLSCLSSLPNLKRIRFEKVSITLLDIPKLQLNSLEKLSLWLCHVNEVLNELEVDTLQSLQKIEFDYCYNLVELPHWVSQVVSLGLQE